MNLTDREKTLLQFLLNADAVARARGDQYGLCDCIDNAGNYYPSAALHTGWLAEAKAMGMKPDEWLTKRLKGKDDTQ